MESGHYNRTQNFTLHPDVLFVVIFPKGINIFLSVRLWLDALKPCLIMTTTESSALYSRWLRDVSAPRNLGTVLSCAFLLSAFS